MIIVPCIFRLFLVRRWEQKELFVICYIYERKINFMYPLFLRGQRPFSLTVEVTLCHCSQKKQDFTRDIKFVLKLALTQPACAERSRESLLLKVLIYS